MFAINWTAQMGRCMLHKWPEPTQKWKHFPQGSGGKKNSFTCCSLSRRCMLKGRVKQGRFFWDALSQLWCCKSSPSAHAIPAHLQTCAPESQHHVSSISCNAWHSVVSQTYLLATMSSSATSVLNCFFFPQIIRILEKWGACRIQADVLGLV